MYLAVQQPLYKECLMWEGTTFQITQSVTRPPSRSTLKAVHCFSPKYLTQAGFQTFLPFLTVSTSLTFVNLPQATAANGEEAGLYVGPLCMSKQMHAWTQNTCVSAGVGDSLLWSYSRVCLGYLLSFFCANCSPVKIKQVTSGKFWIGCLGMVELETNVTKLLNTALHCGFLLHRRQTGLGPEPHHQWHKQHQHVSGAEWSGVHRYVLLSCRTGSSADLFL